MKEEPAMFVNGMPSSPPPPPPEVVNIARSSRCLMKPEEKQAYLVKVEESQIIGVHGNYRSNLEARGIAMNYELSDLHESPAKPWSNFTGEID
ncbi:hypothetical protein CRG98_004598 [Punica granatum]|uniref:Uncharacterized protein n=1 Tax=Punica granatum TaxID=22663 RepID=A0A2I0L3W6_PUNGR|nr:hypothetical protein CRG98_004598 [Punica granatum]